ncbi:MAG TPA: hypothetical protein VMW95_02865 [Desulfobacterales bacterium]|nr:hypothetical protein [Desulfobacterales bacterium]
MNLLKKIIKAVHEKMILAYIEKRRVREARAMTDRIMGRILGDKYHKRRKL